MPDFSDLLIMTDLDGTLLNSDAEISHRNAAAVEYFISCGGHFTFATGRSRAGVGYYLDSVDVNAPAVLSNGSSGWDFAANAPVFTWGVSPREAMALYDAVARALPDCGIEVHTQDGPWIVADNFYTRRHFTYTRMEHRVCAIGDVPQPWINLCLLIDPARMAELLAFVRGGFGQSFFFQQSGAHFLEVQSPRANKGAGALEICRLLGISAKNLYTVGDGTNDIQLLQATANAFAPQNAHPEVLALAPKMLPDNDSHTIEALIEYISGHS